MNTEFVDHQYEYAYPNGIEYQWWHLARNRVLEKEVMKCIGPESAVLDVGCGRGIIVKYLRNKGVDCVGVELAHAQSLSGIEKHVFYGKSAEELSVAERNRFDVILLLDVIEHIADPVIFLRKLTEGFPNLKYVIITVPACPELWSNYDEFYGHYRRYTISMIEDLAKEVYWSLQWRSYFFRSLYLPAWIVAKTGKKRPVKLVAPRDNIRWAHKLISYIPILDYQMLPKGVVGSSIIARFAIGNH